MSEKKRSIPPVEYMSMSLLQSLPSPRTVSLPFVSFFLNGYLATYSFFPSVSPHLSLSHSLSLVTLLVVVVVVVVVVVCQATRRYHHEQHLNHCYLFECTKDERSLITTLKLRLHGHFFDVFPLPRASLSTAERIFAVERPIPITRLSR